MMPASGPAAQTSPMSWMSRPYFVERIQLSTEICTDSAKPMAVAGSVSRTRNGVDSLRCMPSIFILPSSRIVVLCAGTVQTRQPVHATCFEMHVRACRRICRSTSVNRLLSIVRAVVVVVQDHHDFLRASWRKYTYTPSVGTYCVNLPSRMAGALRRQYSSLRSVFLRAAFGVAQALARKCILGVARPAARKIAANHTVRLGARAAHQDFGAVEHLRDAARRQEERQRPCAAGPRARRAP